MASSGRLGAFLQMPPPPLAGNLDSDGHSWPQTGAVEGERLENRGFIHANERER